MAQDRSGRRDRGTGVVVGLPYGRVSTDEQEDEGLSLDAQRAKILAYIAQRGWKAGQWRQDVESGRKVARDEYQQLLAEMRALVKQGRRPAVVVIRGDRLGRKLSEFARAYEECEELGVELHSVREGGALSLLNAGILGTVAAEESRRTAERVRESIEHVCTQGWYFPRRAPWGYQLRPATDAERAAGAPISVLELDPATAPYAQEAWQRAVGGEPVQTISRWAAGLPGDARGGRVLNYTSIRLMLGARVYCGQHADGTPGRWSALVDAGEWERARSHIDGAKRRLPGMASHRYLLSGLLRCPRCGARMSGNAIHAGRYRRYVCHSANDGARATRGACYQTVSTPVIDAVVLAEVEPMVLRGAVALRDELVRRARETDDGQAPDTLGAQLVAAERARGRAQRVMSALTIKLAAEEITRDAYDAAYPDAEDEYHRATTEIERLRAERSGGGAVDLAALVADAQVWLHAWRDGDVRAKRELLAGLITRVSYSREDQKRSSVAPVIEWTAEGDALRELLGLPAVVGGALEEVQQEGGAPLEREGALVGTLIGA